jgi:hypothetical protein
MTCVVVLGGYGRLGRQVAHELVQRTRALLRITGRNAQRAESLALALGARAQAAYADAQDVRVLSRVFEGASAVVTCCGGDQLIALQTALELRVPFVGLSPVELEPRHRRQLAEQAWRARVPAVVAAGALPGLPGVLAESLVRRLPAIQRLYVAALGAHDDSDTARRDRRTAAGASDSPPRAHRLPRIWRFEPPLGRCPMVPAHSAELAAFAESHCVEELVYLEPPTGLMGRALRRLLAGSAAPGFAIAAQAFAGNTRGAAPDAALEVSAPNALLPAAAFAVTLVQALLERRVAAGLSSAREALPPALLLADLEKRGVRVRVS